MCVLFARVSILSVCGLAWVLAFALLPSAGYSQTDSSVDSNPKVQQRLQEIEAMKKDLLRKMQDFDNRIHTLEAEVKRQKSKTAKIAAKAAAPPQQPLPPPQTVVAAKSTPADRKAILANAVEARRRHLEAIPAIRHSTAQPLHRLSKFSGRPSWTPFTTRRVPRRQVFRFFWFRSLPADFRRTPLILTLGSRC